MYAAGLLHPERVDIKKDYGGKIVRNANGATPLPSIR
jgi:hypothetical protein